MRYINLHFTLTFDIVIANLQLYHTISQKWYRLVPKLLENMNMKLYAFYRVV